VNKLSKEIRSHARWSKGLSTQTTDETYHKWADKVAELEQENALRDKRIYELLAELKSAEHFLTQIDPIHWPSSGEAREQIKLIRAVIAKGGEG
jgi:hypothetical protein